MEKALFAHAGKQNPAKAILAGYSESEAETFRERLADRTHFRLRIALSVTSCLRMLEDFC